MPSKSTTKVAVNSSSKPKQQKSKTGSGKKKKSLSKVSTTEPGVLKPVVTEPVVTKPAVTEPIVTKSTVDENTPVPDNIKHTVTESTVPVLGTQEQINNDFNNIAEKITALKTLQLQIVGDIKRLQKNVQRHIKESNKKKKKVLDPNKPKRNPSGFAKPAPLSTELCDFLNRPYGTEMARTDVTREITQYIKLENLQDQKNRRIILPDKKLKTLLSSSDVQDDPVTYFNLQKFLRVHFIKKEEVVVSKNI